MDSADLHRPYIRRCIQLAGKALGKAAPNPLVGAVLVYKDRIIGEGWYKAFGGSHAEVHCINSVKATDQDKIEDSTLYISLEPCCFHGKTPACTDLILRSNIKHVVFASKDPFPKVDGKSISILEDAGIKVEYGILEGEQDELNKRFIKFYREKRPYIILKWAETLNRFAAPINNEQKWISGKLAKKLVHKWRSEEQAILVGVNTVLADQPSLDNRLWSGNSPTPIIIDPDLKTEGKLNSIQAERLFVLNKHADTVTGKINFIKIDFDSFPESFNQFCFEQELQSVFIEGGIFTLNYFIQNNLWDEARIIRSNGSWADGRKVEFTSGSLSDSFQLEKDAVEIYLNT